MSCPGGWHPLLIAGGTVQARSAERSSVNAAFVIHGDAQRGQHGDKQIETWGAYSQRGMHACMHAHQCKCAMG